jgi:hypothetical protein
MHSTVKNPQKGQSSGEALVRWTRHRWRSLAEKLVPLGGEEPMRAVILSRIFQVYSGLKEI